MLWDHLDAVVLAPKDVRDRDPDGRTHFGSLESRGAGLRGTLEESHEVSLDLAIGADVVRQVDALEESEAAVLALLSVIAGLGHELATSDAFEGECVRLLGGDGRRLGDDIDIFAATAEELHAGLLLRPLGNALTAEEAGQVFVEALGECGADPRMAIRIQAVFVQLLGVDHGGLLVRKNSVR